MTCFCDELRDEWFAVTFFCHIFAAEMNKKTKEILKVRAISSAFVVLALAIFKPFGLSAWAWEGYFHLLSFFVLGVMVCLLSDLIMKYVVRMPQTDTLGADYIIRRNLWFQFINTPLIALMICLYRHFLMSDKVEGNLLSWSNFLETLFIIAFCSFAIGLYWRFKFRSQYLTMELEETRMMNEQLKKMQQEADQLAKDAAEVKTKVDEPVKEQQLSAHEEGLHSISSVQPSFHLILSGSTSDTVALYIPDLLYVEAVGNYVKIYQVKDGKVHSDMLRATLKQMEDDLRSYSMIVRCHRAFLVNLQQVEQIVSKSGNMQLYIKHCHEYLPVSRTNSVQVKEALR